MDIALGKQFLFLFISFQFFLFFYFKNYRLWHTFHGTDEVSCASTCYEIPHPVNNREIIQVNNMVFYILFYFIFYFFVFDSRLVILQETLLLPQKIMTALILLVLIVEHLQYNGAHTVKFLIF